MRKLTLFTLSFGLIAVASAAPAKPKPRQTPDAFFLELVAVAKAKAPARWTNLIAPRLVSKKPIPLTSKIAKLAAKSLGIRNPGATLPFATIHYAMWREDLLAFVKQKLADKPETAKVTLIKKHKRLRLRVESPKGADFEITVAWNGPLLVIDEN